MNKKGCKIIKNEKGGENMENAKGCTNLEPDDNFLNKFNKKAAIAILSLVIIGLFLSMSSVSAAYDTYTDISVNASKSVTPNSTFDITGKLYNSSNPSQGIQGQQVNVSIINSSSYAVVASQIVTTNNTGDFRANFNNIATGLYILRINYGGNTTLSYSPTTVNMHVEVKRLATFFLNTSASPDGQFSGYLVDELGNPLGGKVVYLTGKDSNGNPVNYSYTTEANGFFIFTASLNINSGNTAQLNLEFRGENNYSPVTFQINQTSRDTYSIVLDPIKDVVVGDTVTLTGIIRSYGNVNLPTNGNIELWINNVFYKNNSFVGGSNLANFSITGVNLVHGYDNISLIFRLGNNIIVNETLNILVNKIPTKIQLDHPMYFSTGKNNTISGKLVNEYGVGIGGKVVSIYIDNEFFANVTTNVDGTFKITNFIPSSVGNHSITVAFSEPNGDYSGSFANSNVDQTYYFFNDTIEIGVDILHSNLIVSNYTANVTETFTINGTVTADDDDKTNINNGYVNIEILLNGISIRNYTVAINNGKYTISDVLSESGNYTVRVTYLGEPDTYGGSIATGWLNILVYETTTSVNNYTIITKQGVNITGSVVGSKGQKVNGTVNVIITNSTGGITHTFNNVNLDNGNFVLNNVIFNIAGNYTVTVTYTGNRTFGGSYGTGRITVNPMPTTITVSTNTTLATQAVTLVGTVKAQDGTPITGPVTITIRNGLSVVYTTTVMATINGEYQAGNIILNVTGTYQITVTYEGNETYLASTGYGSITVNHMPTTITVSNHTTLATQVITLNGTLRSQSGALVSGPVNITIRDSNGIIVYNTTVTATGGNYNAGNIKLNISGTYNVTVAYAGNGTYSASTGYGTILVNRMPTTSTVSSHTILATQAVTLNGNVRAQDGTGVYGQVTITIRNSSGIIYMANAMTSTFGDYSIGNIIINVTGTYNVTVTYAGDNTYLDSTGYGTLIVNHMPTTTVVSNNTTLATQAVILNGTVKAQDGTGITGQVTITIKNSTGAIVYSTTVNVTSGNYNAGDIRINIIGTYNVEVAYAGNGTYGASTGYGTLTVGLMSTVTVVSNNTTLATQAVTLNGTVFAQDGTPINGQVTITIRNSTGIVYTTNVDVSKGNYDAGNIRINVTGTYNVTVAYLGDNTYGASTGYGTLIVNHMPTTAIVSNNTTLATQAVSLNGTIRAQDGTGITGPVTITIRNSSGVIVYNTTVNATGGNYDAGNIRINVTGTYNVTVAYAGNGTYGASTGYGTILVNPMPTTTTVTNQTTLATQAVSVTGTVRAQDGTAIIGQVTIIIRNSTGVVYTTTTMTTNLGDYNFGNIILNATGTYQVEVTYGGNNTYLASNVFGTITVNPMPTNTNVYGNSSKPGVLFSVSGSVIGTNGALINGTVNINIRNNTLGVNNNYTANVINGTFTLNNINLTNIGDFILTASYGGNGTYSASSGSNIITIGLVDTVLRVYGDTSYSTRSYNITGRLTDVSGSPISGAIININIVGARSVNVTTNTNGEFYYSGIHNLSGNYVIEANYVGQGVYESATHSASLSINPTPTSVSLINITNFVYGKATTFEGVLLDSLNNVPIAGKVEIFVNGQSAANLTTGSNGRFTYVITPNPSYGTYNITVVYYANPTYLGSDNTDGNRNMFGPREMETKIVVQNTTTKVFHNARVVVTLYNEFGDIMAGETIYVTINGVTNSYTTGPNGNVYVSYIATESGNVLVTAVYESNLARKINGDASQGNIKVDMLATSIKMTNLIVNVNQDTTIQATLVDEDGNILVGKTIDVFFEGKYYGSYTTDTNGRIYIKMDALQAGNYMITAHYEGDLINPLIHSGSDSYNTFSVRPINTTTIVTVHQNKNESTTFQARLYDEFHKPVADRPILFFLNGNLIGVAVSDVNGIAVLQYAYTPNGKIVAEFLGDNTYRESFSNKVYDLEYVSIIDTEKYSKKKAIGDNSKEDAYEEDVFEDNVSEENNSENNKANAGVSMLNTANPIGILVLLLLAVFMFGIRRKKN